MLPPRGGPYRGTFLVPLSVPSLLFKNCTVFGTVDTFFALLSSLLGTICGMEFKYKLRQNRYINFTAFLQSMKGTMLVRKDVVCVDR